MNEERQDAESVADPSQEWTWRVKHFLDTRNYDLITQDDLDKLREHWSLGLRLHRLKAELNDGSIAGGSMGE